MPTTTIQKTGIKYGSPITLIYHDLYRGNNLLVQINSKKLISPWNSMNENQILNIIKSKINNISKYKLNVSNAFYDKIETYNDYVIGTGDFLFIVESVSVITEEILVEIQKNIVELKLTPDTILPTYYVDTYGSNYVSEGMSKVILPTLSIFLLHFYGDRTILFKSTDYDIISARTMSKMKNAILSNDTIIPETIKIFTADRNYDISGKAILGDEFAIEMYDESYARTSDFDELLNNLYEFLYELNVSNFYKIWVQTTSLTFLV